MLETMFQNLSRIATINLFILVTTASVETMKLIKTHLQAV